MKYTNSNPPMVCMLTDSACYKGTNKNFVPKGVLWHSTGANNPNLKRYIQPADSAVDKAKMLELLGINQYGNDYNHGAKTRQMGVNAWIGKLADGTVTAIQTLPWNYKPWGCGGGDKGSCNDGWLQFEICEDNLNDKEYAQKVYDEACELTAYWCKMFGLNPLGTVKFKGANVPVIIDHRTSHTLGLGNNHGDVYHWFPKTLGKYLPDIRKDVAALMGIEAAEGVVESETSSAPQSLGYRTIYKGMNGADVKELQNYLLKLGYSLPKYGADGDYGSESVVAVKAFQKDNGLTADGIFGATSLSVLLLKLQNGAVGDISSDTADVTTEKFAVTVTGSVVNVRNAPNAGTGKIMYQVQKGDKLIAMGSDTTTGWWHLEDGNYISNVYCTRVQN